MINIKDMHKLLIIAKVAAFFIQIVIRNLFKFYI